MSLFSVFTSLITKYKHGGLAFVSDFSFIMMYTLQYLQKYDLFFLYSTQCLIITHLFQLYLNKLEHSIYLNIYCSSYTKITKLQSVCCDLSNMNKMIYVYTDLILD